MKNPRLILLLSMLVVANISFAQTSGTLTGTTATYNYSTAPWVITSGPGTYPDGGGVATFNPITGVTPGTLVASSTVVIDVSPLLSQINFNTPFQYLLTAGTGTSIVAAATGLTLNTIATAQNLTVNGVGISIAFGSQISSPISGGGTAGLTRTGSGNLYILGANTYTGGTHFNGGFTTLGGTAAIGDSVLGATGVGNGLSFNGGSVLFNTTGGLTTARDIFIDTGGANLVTNTATTFSGIISGSGTLTDSALSASTLTLTGANTFTGATVIRGANTSSSSAAVAMTLSGNGSLAAGSSYDLMGTFTLDNSGTNLTNRLSDTAPVTLRGANFISIGNATAASSETIGAVTANNGFSNFLVTPGTTAGNSLTMASLTRANNSTLDFRGTGLGGTPGNTVSNIYVTAAPTLSGGGGGAGSTSISIIPFAIGNSNTSTAFTAAGQIGSSFVTYDANGIRPLAISEYATSLGVNPTDNVRISAVTAAPAVATANSLLVAPSVASTAAAPVLTGGPITLTSGAFLYSPTANVTGFVSAGLNFGAAEGLITNTSLLTMTGVLTGTNGLTLTAAYAPTNNYTPNLSLTGANTYVGNTTINSGAIGFSGTVASATTGAFGTTGTVILNGGTILASLVPTAATTFSRDISVIGNGLNYISPSTSGFVSTFSGNISLSNNLNLEGFSNAAASALNFTGNISGTGSLTDGGFTYSTISGNNTYSGGTIFAGVSASTFFAGSDTAFGTGTISFNTATTTLAGVGTTARTFANSLFLNNTPIFGGTAPLTFTGDVNLNGARTINATNTGGTTFSGLVSSGSVTKTGTGALSFTNATGNTYTGGTVLGNSAGILNVNNTSGSGVGTGAISIGGSTAANRSTLSGNFNISGAASISGTLSPGNGATLNGTGSIGTANFGSSLALVANSNTIIEIASAASFDKLNVAGLLTLPSSATTFTFSISTIGGYDAPVGTTFDIVDWGTLASGTFNPATQISFTNQPGSAGTSLDTSNFLVNGTITVVPEPSTWAMIASGAGMLATVLRFRRRRSS